MAGIIIYLNRDQSCNNKFILHIICFSTYYVYTIKGDAFREICSKKLRVYIPSLQNQWIYWFYPPSGILIIYKTRRFRKWISFHWIEVLSEPKEEVSLFSHLKNETDLWRTESSGLLRRVALTRATGRNNPEDTILRSHRRENHLEFRMTENAHKPSDSEIEPLRFSVLSKIFWLTKFSLVSSKFLIILNPVIIAIFQIYSYTSVSVQTETKAFSVHQQPSPHLRTENNFPFPCMDIFYWRLVLKFYRALCLAERSGTWQLLLCLTSAVFLWSESCGSHAIP
jgi:hypothetical protein